MSVFVGRLPPDFDDRDVEDIFYKYGRITSCQVKRGSSYAFAFIDFEDRNDAEDAIRYVNGRDVEGVRIVVERPKGRERKLDTNKCYNCGDEGHWARDCRRSPRSPRRLGGGGRRDYRSRSRSPYRSRSRTPDRYKSRGRDYRSRSREGGKGNYRARSPPRYDDGRRYSRSPSPSNRDDAPPPRYDEARKYSRSPSPGNRDGAPDLPHLPQEATTEPVAAIAVENDTEQLPVSNNDNDNDSQ